MMFHAVVDVAVAKGIPIEYRWGLNFAARDTSQVDG